MVIWIFWLISWANDVTTCLQVSISFRFTKEKGTHLIHFTYLHIQPHQHKLGERLVIKDYLSNPFMWTFIFYINGHLHTHIFKKLVIKHHVEEHMDHPWIKVFGPWNLTARAVNFSPHVIPKMRQNCVIRKRRQNCCDLDGISSGVTEKTSVR